MSIITKIRRQSAIWWSKTGSNSYGQPIYATPVEIECRWEDIAEEFIDMMGTLQISRSKVYVDRDMVVGDILKLGSLDSGIDETTPRNNDDAWEVRRFEKLPNLKASEYLLTAIL